MVRYKEAVNTDLLQIISKDEPEFPEYLTQRENKKESYFVRKCYIFWMHWDLEKEGKKEAVNPYSLANYPRPYSAQS